MTPIDFSKQIDGFYKAAKKLVSQDLPIVIGKKSVDFFKENFQQEGYTNSGMQAWQEVKRRQDPRAKGVRGSRKILTGESGDLGESIMYDPQDSKVVISSDKPYAAAHNDGTSTAGRSRSVVIPQRQFIGDSPELDEIIRSEIDRKFKDLFGI